MNEIEGEKKEMNVGIPSKSSLTISSLHSLLSVSK
jgi:hypothetical protein